MLAILVTALYLSIPVIVAGVAHMAVVRLDFAPNLKEPISEDLFGPNKTWRGVLAMPILTLPGVWIARALDAPLSDHLLVSLHDASALTLAIALGLAYVLAELPNSWWKRRQGIAPGHLPERGRVLYVVVDQADSAVGCALAYAIVLSPPLAVTITLAVLGPAIHLAANAALYAAGLRNRPV